MFLKLTVEFPVNELFTLALIWEDILVNILLCEDPENISIHFSRLIL